MTVREQTCLSRALTLVAVNALCGLALMTCVAPAGRCAMTVEASVAGRGRSDKVGETTNLLE